LAHFSVSGTSSGRDGAITLVIGIVAGILVCLRRFSVVTTLLGAGALVVGIIDTSDISSAGNALIAPSVGWGLVVVDIAAVSLLVWGLVATSADRRRRHVAA
jgi:hypothetical protein